MQKNDLHSMQQLCAFQTVQWDIEAMRDEYLRLKERILKELEDMNDSDKAQFLRSEIGVINQRLGSLESSLSAYIQRYITRTHSICHQKAFFIKSYQSKLLFGDTQDAVQQKTYRMVSSA